ncbi:hypothetical protein [Neosynechococcus sphagnicola]|uniref:hypothetical protein n=1 Tax=Neosynechococcus sphagnicola TaxID=1501145 RepID=UPI000A9C0220
MPFFVNSALDTAVLEKAGLSSVGTFLAMTNNGEVNLVLAQRAVEEFHPPHVLAVFPRDPQVGRGTTPSKVNQAFLPDLMIKTWNQYLMDRDVKLGETILSQEHELGFQTAHIQALIHSGDLIPLLLEREGRLQIVPVGEIWQTGDRLIYLLYAPKPKLLKLLSGSSQPRLTLEKLPEIEDISLLTPALEPSLE